MMEMKYLNKLNMYFFLKYKLAYNENYIHYFVLIIPLSKITKTDVGRSFYLMYRVIPN